MIAICINYVPPFSLAVLKNLCFKGMSYLEYSFVKLGADIVSEDLVENTSPSTINEVFI